MGSVLADGSPDTFKSIKNNVKVNQSISLLSYSCLSAGLP